MHVDTHIHTNQHGLPVLEVSRKAKSYLRHLSFRGKRLPGYESHSMPHHPVILTHTDSDAWV
jgi:hypothetical protein